MDRRPIAYYLVKSADGYEGPVRDKRARPGHGGLRFRLISFAIIGPQPP
jgi:hypothetical protein